MDDDKNDKNGVYLPGNYSRSRKNTMWSLHCSKVWRKVWRCMTISQYRPAMDVWCSKRPTSPVAFSGQYPIQLRIVVFLRVWASRRTVLKMHLIRNEINEFIHSSVSDDVIKAAAAVFMLLSWIENWVETYRRRSAGTSTETAICSPNQLNNR